MNNTKKLKHSKIRNTGLIFEFLVRQITADVLSKEDNSKAVSIIKKRFNENTELGKELLLYNTIINTKFNSDKKADYLIDEVLKQRQSLNNAQLKREKYNLIKYLKENFNLNRFMSSKIKNYKIYASVYKLFEFNDKIKPEEKTETHFNLVEYITTTVNNKERTNLKYKNDEDLRILSYKILLEKFNKKYSKLDVKQKSLLKEYINNISNTNSLKEYIQKEIKYVRKELKSNKKNIKDKITKIKLNEAANSINRFCNIGSKKIVKDKAVVQLMRYYELIKELRKHA